MTVNAKKTNAKVAVFGGTFNPVTEGHLQLVKDFRKENPRCLLVIAPTTRNPWKPEAPVSQYHRLQMLARALRHEGIAHRSIDVSREEHTKVVEELLEYEYFSRKHQPDVLLVNERYVLMADLIYRWHAEILKPYNLGEKLGIVVATDGAHTVQNWKSWKDVEPLVELIEMPIKKNVHSTDVRNGEHPLHRGIETYVRVHLQEFYPNAIRSKR